MLILNYLMDFTIILLLFHYVWCYLIILPLTLLFDLLRLPSKMSYILKLGEAYFSASLTGLVTVGTINEANEMWLKILVGIIGGLFFYFYYGNSVYQKEKQAREQSDYYVLANINSDYWTMFIALALFIVMIFIPQLAITPPILMFSNLVDWLFNLRFIGYILRIILSIVGFYMAITWLINGILFIGFMIATLIAKITSKPEKANSENHLYEDEKGQSNFYEEQNIIDKNDQTENKNNADEPEILANKLFHFIIHSCEKVLDNEELIRQLDIEDGNTSYLYQELLGLYLFIVKDYFREIEQNRSEHIAYYLNHNLSKYALEQAYNEERIQRLLNFVNIRYEEYKEEMNKPDANSKNLGIKLIYFIKGTHNDDEDLLFNVSVYIASFKMMLKKEYNN